MSEQNPNLDNQSVYEDPANQLPGSDAAVEIPAEVQDASVEAPVAEVSVEEAPVEPSIDEAPAAEAPIEEAPAAEAFAAAPSAGTAAAVAGGVTAQPHSPYGNPQASQQFGQPGPQQWSQPASQQPWQQAYQQPAQQYYQQPQANPYADAQYGWQQTSPAVTKGPLERAWEDYMGNVQKVKQTVLLALIGCVPVLGFTVSGYNLKWAEQAARQQGSEMPAKIIDGSNFKFGFFQVLIALVIGLVAGLIACVPVLGWVASLFIVPFVFLASVRMYLYGDLAAGFAVSDLWEKFKNDVGGTMFLAWVPSLIGGAIVSLVFFVAMMLGGVSAMGIIAAVEDHHMALGAGAGMFGLLVLIVMIVVCALIGTVINLVTIRAFGYWAIDHAPDWVAGTAFAQPQAGYPYNGQPPYGQGQQPYQQNPYQQYQQPQQYAQPWQQPQQWQQPSQQAYQQTQQYGQPMQQQWQPQAQQPQAQPQQDTDQN